jgi:hypothetical protein
MVGRTAATAVMVDMGFPAALWVFCLRLIYCSAFAVCNVPNPWQQMETSVCPALSNQLWVQNIMV